MFGPNLQNRQLPIVSNLRACGPKPHKSLQGSGGGPEKSIESQKRGRNFKTESEGKLFFESSGLVLPPEPQKTDVMYIPKPMETAAPF